MKNKIFTLTLALFCAFIFTPNANALITVNDTAKEATTVTKNDADVTAKPLTKKQIKTQKKLARLQKKADKMKAKMKKMLAKRGIDFKDDTKKWMWFWIFAWALAIVLIIVGTIIAVADIIDPNTGVVEEAGIGIGNILGWLGYALWVFGAVSLVIWLIKVFTS